MKIIMPPSKAMERQIVSVIGDRLRGVTPLNVDHGVVVFRDDVGLG